jgi:hypothetical protein
MTLHDERKARLDGAIKAGVPIDTVESVAPSYVELHATRKSLQKPKPPTPAEIEEQARRGAAAAAMAANSNKQTARETGPSQSVPVLTLDSVSEDQMSRILDVPFHAMTLDQAKVTAEYYSKALNRAVPETLQRRLKSLGA